MKTKLLLLILTLVGTGKDLAAQKNYVAGYVITEGDTLRGWIDYQNWSSNPTSIKFKTHTDAAAQTYQPEQITGFEVAGNRYVSRIVTVEYTLNTVDKLEADADFNLRTDTLFLKVIVDGNKSLLYHQAQTNRENFYIERAGATELLRYKRYFKSEDSRKIVENRSFVSQLDNYLKDCPTISGRMSETAYELEDLRLLFTEYYQCTQAVPSFQQQKDKVTANFGALAGGSLTTAHFSSNSGQVEYLTEGTLSSSPNFSGGVYLDFIFPKNNRKWIFSNEILYSSYQTDGEHVVFRFNREDFFTKNETQLGYPYLKLNNILRYRFPVNDFFLFVNGGISNGVGFNLVNERQTERQTDTFFSMDEGRAIEEVRALEQGVILGFGASRGKFSLQTRLEAGNGISAFGNLRSTVLRYFLLVGYEL